MPRQHDSGWKRRAAFIGGVTLLIVAAAVAYHQGWGWGDEPSSSPDSVASVPDAALPEPMAAATDPGPAASAEVSTTDLFREYRDSAGRVDSRYRGQRLKVKGPVASVEQGEGGLTLLTLSAGPDLESIRAVIAPADQGRAAALAGGTAVALDCLHHGMVMGEPVLADCRLAK